MIKYSHCKKVAKEKGLKMGMDAYAVLEGIAEVILLAAVIEAEREGVTTVRPDHLVRARESLIRTWTSKLKKKKKG